MEDIPIHDEQGTRDGSFDIWVDFHPSFNGGDKLCQKAA